MIPTFPPIAHYITSSWRIASCIRATSHSHCSQHNLEAKGDRKCLCGIDINRVIALVRDQGSNMELTSETWRRPTAMKA